MTEKSSYRTRGEIPEAASATSIVLLTLATLASGVGAVFWWHAPLAMCALVVGSYVLHLFAVRRAARDAVVAQAAEARRVAVLREQEFEQQLRDVARLQPELEKERARMEEQWQHLKGLVDEREGRKKTLKEYEASLESVRTEAAAALDTRRQADFLLKLARKLSACGLTYRALVDEVRFAVAKELLQQPDVRIASVAWSVGFDDHSYFRRMFRRVGGLTPGQMRMAALRERA